MQYSFSRLMTILALASCAALAQSQTKPGTQQPKTGTPQAQKTQEARGSLSASETKFVQEVLEGGRHEVEMARMAVNQASDAQVKSFARRLVTDHSAVNRKLEEIARKYGVAAADAKTGTERTSANEGVDPKTAPTSKAGAAERSGTPAAKTGKAPADTKGATADMDRLASLKGAEFDRAFVQIDDRQSREGHREV